MAIGIFNPLDEENSSTSRPTHVNTGGGRRWFLNGTILYGQDMNMITAQFRDAMDFYGIADDEGDDTALRKLLAKVVADAYLGAETQSIASAATTSLGTTTKLSVEITGNVTITSFGTGANQWRIVRLSGTPTLTHHTTNLILPGGKNIVAKAGDTFIAVSNSAAEWRVYAYQRADGLPLSTLAPVTIASAATVDLGSTLSEHVTISGTTTITSFGTTAPIGAIKNLYFTGILTLTHGSNLVMPGAADFVTAVGDQMMVRFETSSLWRCMHFSRTSGYGNSCVVDTFVGNGSWTKRAGARAVTVIAVGGGAGGGSGRRGATSTVRAGGSGGGAGAVHIDHFPASLLAATETVEVSAGGAGGAAATVDSTSGVVGVGAVLSKFGEWVKAGGGGRGQLGATANNAGGGGGGWLASGGTNSQAGAPTQVLVLNAPYGGGAGVSGAAGEQGAWGGPSGGGANIAGAGGAGGSALHASGAGGAGGSVDAANVIQTPGIGGATATAVATGGGGAAGNAGAAGGAGSANSVFKIGHGAYGGGGGGGNNAGVGGAGGVGGFPGGGGGGGGASLNGFNSGAGGDGGGGVVYVITYF